MPGHFPVFTGSFEGKVLEHLPFFYDGLAISYDAMYTLGITRHDC